MPRAKKIAGIVILQIPEEKFDEPPIALHHTLLYYAYVFGFSPIALMHNYADYAYIYICIYSVGGLERVLLFHA